MPSIGVSGDLRLIAETRADDATVLLGQGRYSGAFYLAGYAVECGLKAILASTISEFSMPDLSAVRDAYIHDLEKLATQAGLASLIAADPDVGPSWLAAKVWRETSRYSVFGEQEANDLVQAVTAETTGVLPWLKQYW